MIHESSYWKNDLIKLADKLELRLIQSRWGDKNLYTVEKEIFIGFYSIRKLIESKKVSDFVKEKEYEVKQFLYKGNPDSFYSSFADDFHSAQADIYKRHTFYPITFDKRDARYFASLKRSAVVM